MKEFKGCKNYTVVGQEELKDINSKAFILSHDKTKARIVLIQNEDEDKGFIIGFKTPQNNSTGVPHILEHSVLCGSEHFPVKDAMMEVSKGSLNTFMNAFTYPDRTLYPISSNNDKDFQNLMHVYLDAVFFPRVYKDKRIFMQEGWHYEYDEKENKLSYNGVVYNEMKGVYSSPDQLLDTYIQFSLFPDNQYGVESGGAPEHIPELSYEDFVSFHKKLYHPSNSRIYLYGNMDFEEKLTFIDEEYLSKFDYLDIDTEILVQKPFKEAEVIEKSYPVSADEDTANSAYLSYNVVCSDSKDVEATEAMDVINYALCSVPGSKLKQRLLDAGIGMDVDSELLTDLRDKTFSIIAQNAEASDRDRFVKIIEDTIKEIIEEGFDRKTLEAAITSSEFTYREADFGYLPKSLMYGMFTFDEWNYSDDNIFEGIKKNAVFDKLRKGIDRGLFEKILKERVLENTHKTILVLKPEQGLQEKKDKELEDKLAGVRDSFSKAELENIAKEADELQKYHDEKNSEEALKTVPHLSITDLKKENTSYDYQVKEVEGIKEVTYEFDSNGILYACIGFSVNSIPKRLLPALSVLKILLGNLNTKSYTFGEFINEVNIVSGGISGTVNIYQNAFDNGVYDMDLEVRFKTFYGTIEKCLDLINEMLFTSKLSDKKRIKELILESKTKLETYASQSGHAVGVQRVSSYFSKCGSISDTLSGYGQYLTVADLAENFDDKIDGYISDMKEILDKYISSENLILNACGERDGIDKFNKEMKAFIKNLPNKTVEPGKTQIEFSKKNEGLTNPGMVCFVTAGGNYKKSGLTYDGSLMVLKEMLTNDYLYTELRLKGGAYGQGCLFRRNGDVIFTSYRDPNLRKSLESYRGASEYVKAIPDDRELLDNYIISTIGGIDTPLSPSLKASKVYAMFRTGLTNDFLQLERDQVLTTDINKLHSLYRYIDEALKDNNLVVVGSEAIINKDKDLFMEILPINR